MCVSRMDEDLGSRLERSKLNEVSCNRLLEVMDKVHAARKTQPCRLLDMRVVGVSIVHAPCILPAQGAVPRIRRAFYS